MYLLLEIFKYYFVYILNKMYVPQVCYHLISIYIIFVCAKFDEAKVSTIFMFTYIVDNFQFSS